MVAVTDTVAAAGAANNGAQTSGETLNKRLKGRIRSQAILRAMRHVAREDFLDDSMLSYAGDDAALPIGYAQTTSSPFIIARMLEMLGGDTLTERAKILEVGVGCGYQTALLATLGYTVVGIERIRALADGARRRLKRLHYRNVQIFHGDGLNGRQAQAPYDGIIMCAESAAIPPALIEQLSEDGRLVLPLIGERRQKTHLVAVNAQGKIISRREPVSFVPMKGGVV